MAKRKKVGMKKRRCRYGKRVKGACPRKTKGRWKSSASGAHWVKTKKRR